MNEVRDIGTDLARARADALKEGGGGGTFDGMEQRVGKLEFQMGQVLADTGALKADVKSIGEKLDDLRIVLARTEAKLESKVDYKWMTIYVLAIVAALMKEEILAMFK